MFVPTKATMKVATGNTGHAQGIGIILYHFTNSSIIYPAEPVYYCIGHLSNTISSVALKFYACFKKVTSEPIEHCDFLTLKVIIGDHHTRLKTILTIFKYKFVKVNPHIDKIVAVLTVCALSKNKSLNLFISVLVVSLLPD